MQNFSIACEKSELQKKIREMMTIEERMSIDAGLAFGGTMDGVNIFIGTNNEWKTFELLQDNYNN